MPNNNKILNDMRSLEGQKRLIASIDKFMPKLIAREKQVQNIISNTKYVDWLNEFTKKYQMFFDDDEYTDLCDFDKNMIDNLNLLYDGINNYATENYIYPVPCDFGNYYNIQLDNVGYQIGRLIGQGKIVSFCQRVKIDNNNFTNFTDIVNNKTNDKIEKIGVSLNNLSKSIISLAEDGIPLEAIENVLVETINNLYEKRKIETKKSYQKKIN